MATATREEIQVRIDAMNAAWQAYVRVYKREEGPVGGAEHSNALRAAEQAYFDELEWLKEHGIADTHTWDDATLTWVVDEDTILAASL
jgi:hypothetical protein